MPLVSVWLYLEKLYLCRRSLDQALMVCDIFNLILDDLETLQLQPLEISQTYTRNAPATREKMSY